MRSMTLVVVLSLAGPGCRDPGVHADPYACSQPAASAGPIALEWPRALQVVQHEGGYGDIRVRGRIVAAGPDAVQARYRNGPWVRIAADPQTGLFDGTLSRQPTGWGGLDVALAANPAVRTTVTPVGVGNVVVLAGQSNMVMWLATRHVTLRGATVLGMRRDPGDPQAIEWANDPLHDCMHTTGSIWPVFGDRLIQGSGGMPVMFVAAALGAAGLVTPPVWAPDGNLFDGMLDQVRVATAERMCAAALLWLQGETDARYGVTREAYRDALVSLADAFEAAMSCEVPIVAGSIGDVEATGWLEHEAADAIRQGTFDAIDASPHLFDGPWTQDLPLTGLHFTDAAADPLLDRWCAAVAAAPTGLACAD